METECVAFHNWAMKLSWNICETVTRFNWSSRERKLLNGRAVRVLLVMSQKHYKSKYRCMPAEVLSYWKIH